MMTCSGRQYTHYYPLIHVIHVASPKLSPEEFFILLDLDNIQGGLHDLPKYVDSWIPKFTGEVGAYGNTHWTKFCESYEFHQSRK
jgi:hypothetical protein